MGGQMTIVLVDDEPFILQATARMLDDAGYDVRTCSAWSEVVAVIRQSSPDLVLLDYNMPAVKGDDICGALKRNLPDLSAKVVLFSSEEEAKLKSIARTCGADGYLSKTTGRARILDGVRGFLGLEAAPVL
jgi:DNA-binding response OmpR family regulator